MIMILLARELAQRTRCTFQLGCLASKSSTSKLASCACGYRIVMLPDQPDKNTIIRH
jgi:hypothetical protein